VVVSNPNFLYSPREVFNSVAGLSESSVENDASFLDIEPVYTLFYSVDLKHSNFTLKLSRLLEY